jgi:glucan phosphoethanolaminetransferase (alkaline phosphatase superfamily)
MTSYNKNPQIAVESPPSGREARVSWPQWSRFCRTETAILLIGLLCLIVGKFLFMRRENAESWLLEIFVASRRDVLFFGFIYLLFIGLYLIRCSPLVARLNLILAILVTLWSFVNIGWLFASSVQLQPGIFRILITGFGEHWPLVQAHIQSRWLMFIFLGLIFLMVLIYFFWKLVWPKPVSMLRRPKVIRALVIIFLLALLIAIGPAIEAKADIDFKTEALCFSSHWYALTVPFRNTNERPLGNRKIHYAGERNVVMPANIAGNRPNVVLILLESVPYCETSLANPQFDTTPHLQNLAAEGVEFQTTRVVIPQTTKAFWTVFTGTRPMIESTFLEAVPAETPYESLASILARAGYRCGFFEMSKGSFECGPGLFWNLSFEWAWFRENMEDPSVHLGRLGGDDCRAIEPAFQWAVQQESPFFLAMISTVAHHPFMVPSEFGEPQTDMYANYQKAVKYTDYFLGEICQQLKTLGLEDNTLLCVLGDHGISFRNDFDSARWVPYEELIAVPWVVRWPGKVAAGQKIDSPCSQMDVAPTLLSLMGFDVSQAGFEGLDALGDVPEDRRLYFSSWYDNSPRGYIESGQKFVYWPYLDKVVMFDLDNDSKELKSIPVAPELSHAVISSVIEWQNQSLISFEPTRFTEQFLFNHWKTFSAGGKAWAYYVTADDSHTK